LKRILVLILTESLKKILLSQVDFQNRNGLNTTQTFVGDLCQMRSTLSYSEKRLFAQKNNQIETIVAYEALLNSNQPRNVI
jgi:hypothetical protein